MLAKSTTTAEHVAASMAKGNVTITLSICQNWVFWCLQLICMKKIALQQ
jgi:hypothetical protein